MEPEVVGDASFDEEEEARWGSGMTSLVIGDHVVGADESIKQVKVIERGEKIKVDGYTSKVDIRPDESHLVLEVNARVDQWLSEGKLMPDAAKGENRTFFVHRELLKAVREYRERKAAKEAAVQALQTPSPPPEEKRTAMSEVEPVYLGMPVEAVASPTTAMAILPNSLRIPGLGERPAKPKKLILQLIEDSTEIKLKCHWIIRVGEEMLVLVHDGREKPMKRSKIQQLLAYTEGSAILTVMPSADDAPQQAGMNIVFPVQEFEFGALTFIILLQAD